MDNGTYEGIPEHWYEKTPSKFVCLRCHRTFSREYKSRSLRGRKKPHGANMFSLWAWYNFRRHLLKCWGWHTGSPERAARGKEQERTERSG